MTGTGACKWCGQERIVEVDTGAETEAGITQEELDRAATWECGCQMARAEKDRIERLQMIQDYLAEEFSDKTEAGDVMLAAAGAIMKKKAKEVTMKDGTYTYQVKRNSDDMIEITRTRTEKESMEY